MTPRDKEALILQEALEVCRCIKHEGGILATPTLLHVRRMMEVYDDRPIEGKWLLWTQEQDTKGKS